MKISKYIYFLMAVLLINVTLVRDLKIKNIGMEFSSEKSATSQEEVSSEESGYFSVLSDEFSETGEEEESEEENENKNEKEDDDLFFSTLSDKQGALLSFNYTFDYKLSVSSFILRKATPPPRMV